MLHLADMADGLAAHRGKEYTLNRLKETPVSIRTSALTRESILGSSAASALSKARARNGAWSTSDLRGYLERFLASELRPGADEAFSA